MATYLLTWNPEKWEWEDLQNDIAEVSRKGFLGFQWSSGVTKKILPNDRIYLIKLGKPPRGIVASGWATSKVERDTHFKDKSKKALYIHLNFDTILNPDKKIFPIDILLNDHKYKDVHWTPQASGMTIPDDVAKQLEKDWATFLNQPVSVPQIAYADEIDIKRTFYEGVAKSVKVNIYERNPQARAICVRKYGACCTVCGFDFAKKFGEIGEGFIHVHHLKPLSEIRKGYKLKPVDDLRPVCPNCHAMLHQRKPEPYTIEELKAILKQASR